MSSPARNRTASAHKMYVGLYHYDGYFNSWDVVLGVRAPCIWIVQEVDIDGTPVGEVREHCSPMAAYLFAEKPFYVSYAALAEVRHG